MSTTSTAGSAAPRPSRPWTRPSSAYVASYLAGRDVLLMAADWARCRELSARIRDDLIHLGLVDNGRTIRIADGAEASAGDLIICRRNDHGIEAGEPGRALANGDILRIEAITSRGIMVRRLLDPDPATGQRRFTDQAFCYAGYRSADLAYAITGHSAQGGTVHTGIALVTGSEDRQWLYPAMTRGTDANLAFVFTTPARPADPQPGTRPAPELDRYERIRHERDGYSRLPRPRSPDRAARTRASRSPCSPTSSAATAPSCPPPRPGGGTWPTPTTSPSCTRSGPPKPAPPATTATASWSWPRCRPATGRNCPTRPGGCSAPCAPPNSPAWTPPRSSAPPSPPGTWPEPGTSPPSWTPGSASASTRCSPSPKAPGPAGSPSCPTRTGMSTWPRSPP